MLQTHIKTLCFAIPAVVLVAFLLYIPLDSPPRIKRGSQQNAFRIVYPTAGAEESQPSPKKFTIHVWKHGRRMTRRFLRSYGNVKQDPYKFCSVNNCYLSTNDSEVQKADAVLFHLHQTRGPETLPRTQRSPAQVWIFFTDESPYHTFFASHRYSMKDYDGIFNWSMTYRMDSDVAVPYGRTVALSPEEQAGLSPLPDFAQSNNLNVAIMGSNCGGRNHRWDYVHELQKYTNVDVYGHCGHLKCPGNFANDCPNLNKYKFYLAFENSNCKEYMTEKLWWNAYEKDSVPVIMGASRKDCEALCPPHSFLHVDDFATPLDLAMHLEMLAGNSTAYNQLFEWKKKYKVLNEHGYFGSPSLHLCRICEKLNEKAAQPKTYVDLKSFWNRKNDCPQPVWISKTES